MRTTCAALALALAAGLGLIGQSSPAGAEPTIEDVQSRVDRLYHEAEEAQERYHDVKLELAQLNKELGGLKSDQRRATTTLEGIRDQARSTVLRNYTGSNRSSLGALLDAGTAGALLDEMSTFSAYQQIQDGLIDDYAAGVKSLNIRRTAVKKRLVQVADLEAELQKEKEAVDEKYDAAKSLLDRLKEEERQEILSRDNVRVPSDVPASGRAAVAVKWALAQVGKAYVYGAAGPSAFDCSGLTMRAWGAAGVALPHSSRAQYGMGPHIARSALQPGDLVFFYSPISHVGMYIGNGLIVHASNPRTGVLVAPLGQMPYVGAVRPG